MNVQIKYIESQSNPAVMRKGGVYLKGLAREDRQPVHLLFLIDVSGSMDEEQRLANVKRSMSFILPFLSAQDQISIVTFSDDAKIVLSRFAVSDDNKRATEYRVSQIRTQGNTNLSAGLLTCARVFEQPPTDTIQRKQGLVILTDGHANAGVTTEAGVLDIVKNLLNRFPGLAITSVGYGETHNSDLMSKIGIEGGGSYNIVKNLEDVASVFGEILGGLMSCSAQMIEVFLPPGVECDTLYSKEVLEGGITKIRIGDLYAESEQILIFKSSPDQGPIKITGVSMPAMQEMEWVQPVSLLAEGDEPDKVLKLADYRQQVSMILKELKSSHMSISTSLKEKAVALKTLLESSSFNEDPLVQMMIEDLKTITDVRADEPYSLHEMASAVTQHATYLGVSRGLRTPSNQGSVARNTAPRMRRQANAVHAAMATMDETYEPPPTAPGSAALAPTDSLFSNPVQRHITSTLRSMTSQQPQDSQLEEID